jgi:hypothetical protein
MHVLCVFLCRRHKSVIVLTTHSMEEADLLCDDIHIMAEGRLAASGSPLSLKARYGVGYTLTVVLQQQQSQQQQQQQQQRRKQQTRPGGQTPAVPGGLHQGAGGGSSSSLASSSSAGDVRQLHSRAAAAQAAADGLLQLVQQHVPSAQVMSAAGSEVSMRLPKEEAAAFPAALRALDAAAEQLGVSSYGLSVTTLEEVFLSIADQAVAMPPCGSSVQPQQGAVANGVNGGDVHSSKQQASSPSNTQSKPGVTATTISSSSTPAAVDHGDLGACEEESSTLAVEGGTGVEVLTGVPLYLQQLKALFIKRALSAR